ncbi:hypothetical protein V1512DRAFT_222128 [Lipomyces arxii]|uniref:uncharacterized protein n=1 Tax=Lipomyces arxii TaxID=56418 RepID=UPI0034CFB364
MADRAESRDLRDRVNDRSDAQAEWDESLRQIQFIFVAILFPLVGRLMGRGAALKIFTRMAVRYALMTKH